MSVECRVSIAALTSWFFVTASLGIVGTARFRYRQEHKSPMTLEVEEITHLYESDHPEQTIVQCERLESDKRYRTYLPELMYITDRCAMKFNL